MGMPADNLLCLANEAFWLSRGLISALYRKGNPNLVIIGEMSKNLCRCDSTEAGRTDRGKKT